MKKFLIVLPYQVVNSIYLPLPALVVLNSGGGAVEVGILATIRSVTSFFAPLIWSKYMRFGSKKLMIALGYLGIFLGTFLLQFPALVYLASLVLAFFPPAIHYAALAIAKESENFAAELGSLHTLNNISSIFGTLLGFFLALFLGPHEIAVLVSFLSLLLLPIASRSIGEEGIFPVFDEGLTEFETFAKSLVKEKVYSIPKVSGTQTIFYLLTASILAAANSLMWSQIITAIKHVLKLDAYVYAFSIGNRIAQVIAYQIASKLKEKSFIPGLFMRIFSLALGVLAINLKNPVLFAVFYSASGFSWPFFQVFYDYTGLILSEEVFGLGVSLRTLASAVSNSISGFLVELFGLTSTLYGAFFLYALTLPLYTLLLKKLKERGKK